jgi:hypothetical protein
VPFAGGDLDVGAGDLLALAAHHAVEAHVVLQRIRAHDVVVVAVDESHGEARSLVDLSRDCLETDRRL